MASYFKTTSLFLNAFLVNKTQRMHTRQYSKLMFLFLLKFKSFHAKFPNFQGSDNSHVGFGYMGTIKCKGYETNDKIANIA